MSRIIKSYGLFWLAENVFWGRGRQRGTLLGVSARARSGKAVDFRDQIGIYVLYLGHKMIYVGQTGSGRQKMFGRLRKHTRDTLAGRWDRFSWFGLRSPLKNGDLSSETMRAGAPLPSVLDHMEAIIIASAEPVLNKQGGRFGTGTRYLQVRDERLGPTTSEMLREIWQRR